MLKLRRGRSQHQGLQKRKQKTPRKPAQKKTQIRRTHHATFLNVVFSISRYQSLGEQGVSNNAPSTHFEQESLEQPNQLE
jgi:hypothetical protein